MADFEITWPERPARLNEEDQKKQWGQEPIKLSPEECKKIRIDKLYHDLGKAEYEDNFNKYERAINDLIALGEDVRRTTFYYEIKKARGWL